MKALITFSILFIGTTSFSQSVYYNGSRVGEIESDGDVYVNGSRVGQF